MWFLLLFLIWQLDLHPGTARQLCRYHFWYSFIKINFNWQTFWHYNSWAKTWLNLGKVDRNLGKFSLFKSNLRDFALTQVLERTLATLYYIKKIITSSIGAYTFNRHNAKSLSIANKDIPNIPKELNQTHSLTTKGLGKALNLFKPEKFGDFDTLWCGNFSAKTW